MNLNIKFICVLSCCMLILGVSKAHAQLTISGNNTEIKNILKQIESQSDYTFFYSDSSLDLMKKVSINVKDQPVEQVLNTLFRGTNIQYQYQKDTKQIALLKSTDTSKTTSGKGSDQQKKTTVSGTVKDAGGEPIVGASIVEKNAGNNGTVTDMDGRFTLTITPGSMLHVSYLGYKGQEIKTTGQTSFEIILQEDSKLLDEVVVVGYGTMRKRDLTAAISSVKGDELNAYPAGNVMQALAGRAAGVSVKQNTGRPGAGVSIRIRGTNSIQGNNEPLYVIDGFPYSGAPTILSNSDIESIEILKDASATAIYGSRGANGVVLITTKQAKEGPTRVEYEGSYSIQSVRKKLDLLNATEWATLYNEQQMNDVGKEYFTPDQVKGFGEGYDWQDLIFRTAPMHNHNVSIMGGSDKTQFSISGRYFDQKGIIENTGYTHGSVSAKVNSQLSKRMSVSFNTTLSTGTSAGGPTDAGSRGSGGSVSAALAASPTLTPYKEDGTYTVMSTAYPFMSNVAINPILNINEISDENRAKKVLLNGVLNYEPVKGLLIKLSAGLDQGFNRTNYYRTTKFVNSKGYASYSMSEYSNFVNENIISYTTKIKEAHSLSATLALTDQKYTNTGVTGVSENFLSDVPGSYSLTSGEKYSCPSSFYSEWFLLSYLGRINYAFKDKYLLTASFRSDGSSRYSEGDKWGFFPSGSLAWRLSEEQFMKQLDFISDMKIRVGYGETGSTAIDPYATLDVLVPGKTALGESLYTTYAPSSRLPMNLKWETTKQFDAGIDLSLLDNRIRFSADYYIKKTHNLLNTASLPASIGYTYMILNVGKIQNKGLEFSLGADIFKGDFNWNLSANLSFNKNEVLQLNNGDPILAGSNLAVGNSINEQLTILMEGEAIGKFYGYKETGYDEKGNITYRAADGSDTTTPSAKDKVFIGDPNPDFIYGLNSYMSYKGFEFSFFLQGSQGNDIFNVNKALNLDYGFGLNMSRDVLYDHWKASNTKEENAQAMYPRISRNTTGKISDRFVENGSYLRLKNIEIAYSLPLDKIGLDNFLRKFQLYASGQNLITLTNYSWFDPDINNYGGGTSVMQGVDHFSFPTARTFTFGVRISY